MIRGNFVSIMFDATVKGEYSPDPEILTIWSFFTSQYLGGNLCSAETNVYL